MGAGSLLKAYGMKEIERASIMRIASDLIRADAIIDLRELSFLDKIRSKYGISVEDERKSFSITLQEAVSCLQASQESLLQDFLGDMSGAIMSDNLCSRQENIFLMMLVACFTNKLTESAAVYSVKYPEDVIFDDAQILYLEGEFYGTYNNEIVSHYREIVNELRLIGFNFVYLPKVGEHYGQLQKEELCNLIRFLYPDIDDTKMCSITQQITTLTTSDFCKEQVAKRLGMSELSEALPSLMLKIGNSVVKDQIYSNFLVITMEDDPLPLVQQFCNLFVDTFQPRVINPTYEGKNRFAYRGFYKQIFDAFISRKGIRSSVVVDIFHGNILLPEAGVKLEGLHRREKALYALFLLESKSGGINFNRPLGLKSLEKYNHRMEAIQQKYAILYENFGGERSRAPRIDVSTNRLPMIALIKKQIRALGDLLNEGDDYLVQRNMYGNYCVKLPPELCKCFEASKRINCSFSESEFWQRLLAM